MKVNAVFFLPHQPQLAAFHQLRNTIYGNDCPPDEINPQYLLTCLLVYNNGMPAGRLCLYYNAVIDEKKTILFGNIEFINNALVFEKLITEAAAYAYQNGYHTLLGPINGSTWDEYRLPLTNEGRQFVTDLPQPLYYAEHLIQYGFTITQRYYTQQSILAYQPINQTLEKGFRQQGVNIRPISIIDYKKELKQLYPFCIDAFSKNVYYSPVDEADFIAKYEKLQPLLQPEFVFIAENNAQEIVAFLLCLPDVYYPKRIVMKTMARSNEQHLKGLMTHMINLLHNNAVAAGYTSLLHAFYHQSNRSAVLSQKYNGQPFKSYALFQKQITG